jgi:hypothetical protein
MNEMQAMLEHLAGLRGRPRNQHTEAALKELEESMHAWPEPYSDKEIEHILADRRIAALLVLLCPPEYKDRVTKIAQAYSDGNYWQYY